MADIAHPSTLLQFLLCPVRSWYYSEHRQGATSAKWKSSDRPYRVAPIHRSNDFTPSPGDGKAILSMMSCTHHINTSAYCLSFTLSILRHFLQNVLSSTRNEQADKFVMSQGWLHHTNFTAQSMVYIGVTPPHLKYCSRLLKVGNVLRPGDTPLAG